LETSGVNVDSVLARGFDFLYGPCFRNVGAASVGRKVLHLTFDDGPDPHGTPRVLDLLDEFGAQATFFLIGDRATKNPELVRETIRRGHTIGNHSPDHRYSNYFSGRARLREWISAGERAISEVAGSPTVGFRPPAGVRTPELVRAAQELATPMILWQTRFYDTRFVPKPERLTRTLATARSGDIILFHDSQREERLGLFLASLRVYLEQVKSESFTLRALERSHFHV
jgi:peptidoglycan/xylan/chitin deacetylase (PgdA/CDA1 family)